jgi:hypothetical protein
MSALTRCGSRPGGAKEKSEIECRSPEADCRQATQGGRSDNLSELLVQMYQASDDLLSLLNRNNWPRCRIRNSPHSDSHRQSGRCWPHCSNKSRVASNTRWTCW